ncbi:MAG: MBL fold metallo-hydrolase [Chloroflexi bacterium]|nr:MBL fold metallo-hydrolase [Chloroflexota bacterium]
MSNRFQVRFWGVRGSYPVPGPATVAIGGNTPCIEVNVDGHLIILDAGTGIIGLGQELARRNLEQNRPTIATILFSHTHHDHTQGLPFFLPAYQGGNTFYIFGPRTFDQDLEEALSKAMLPPAFPVQFQDLYSFKIIRNLEETDLIVFQNGNGDPEFRHRFGNDPSPDAHLVVVHVQKSYAHPQGGVYHYRIEWAGKSVVYATDTEGYLGSDRRLSQFARGTDLLIHDAQFTENEYLDPGNSRQGWGHSTPTMATAVASAAGVHTLVLFHHDPSHDDEAVMAMEREARQSFPNTYVAHEGLSFDLLNMSDRLPPP